MKYVSQAILLFVSMATIEAAFSQDLSVSKEPVCADSTVLIIKTSEQQNKNNTANHEIKPLPPQRPEWIDGWEFLGLTKEQLFNKVMALNESVPHDSRRFILDNTRTSIYCGRGYRRGAYFLFQYDQGKIARYRISARKNKAKSAWIEQDDKAKAITQEIQMVTALTWNARQDLMNDLKKSEEDKSPRQRAKILSLYQLIRDYYIKSANLAKEAGLNSSGDEALARKYSDEYEDFYVSNYNAEGQRPWNRFKHAHPAAQSESKQSSYEFVGQQRAIPLDKLVKPGCRPPDLSGGL